MKVKDGLSSWCYNCKRIADKKYQARKRKDKDGYKTHESKEYRSKYPEKVKAQQLLNYPTKNRNVKKSACVVCGVTQGIDGHHPDYTKPLIVIWVCPIHHKQIHKLSV